TDSRTELVGALNRHLLAQRQAGRRAIVVIDEAQALAVEVLEQLRLLSNLETTTEKLLRIILVGQPQLRMLLLHPELVQLNQRITLRWHIGPLTRRETAAYIEHRLAIASRGQASRIFTRPALRLIHRPSARHPFRRRSRSPRTCRRARRLPRRRMPLRPHRPPPTRLRATSRWHPTPRSHLLPPPRPIPAPPYRTPRPWSSASGRSTRGRAPTKPWTPFSRRGASARSDRASPRTRAPSPARPCAAASSTCWYRPTGACCARSTCRRDSA